MSSLRLLALCALFVACGGSTPGPPEAPGLFDPSGLRLVIGVDRTKTIEVMNDGTVMGASTGDAAMKFVGHDLRTADGSKTLLSLEGDQLRGGDKALGHFEGNALILNEVRLFVTDDGVVHLERGGNTRTMRMHFEGPVAGHRRPAMMLVALVFALYVATHPTATLDRYVD